MPVNSHAALWQNTGSSATNDQENQTAPLLLNSHLVGSKMEGGEAIPGQSGRTQAFQNKRADVGLVACAKGLRYILCGITSKCVLNALFTPAMVLCQRSSSSKNVRQCLLILPPTFVKELLIARAGQAYLHIRSKDAAATAPSQSCSSDSLSGTLRQNWATGEPTSPTCDNRHTNVGTLRRRR